MTGIQGFLACILEEVPSQPHVNSGSGTVLVRSQKVVQDELVEALMEKVAADAKPRREPTLEEHDRQHHPGGFNPETETCKFRENLKKKVYLSSALLHVILTVPRTENFSRKWSINCSCCSHATVQPHLCLRP